MSQSSGAYGEADATEQKNEQHNNQPQTRQAPTQL